MLDVPPNYSEGMYVRYIHTYIHTWSYDASKKGE